MHEKMANAFEAVIAVIMTGLIVMVFFFGLLGMIFSNPLWGIMIILLGLLLILAMFGVLSIFVSIRHQLIAINQQLRNRHL